MQVLVDFTRLIVLDASIRRRVEPENLKIDRNLPEQSNHINSSIRRTSRCNWDRSEWLPLYKGNVYVVDEVTGRMYLSKKSHLMWIPEMASRRPMQDNELSVSRHIPERETGPTPRTGDGQNLQYPPTSAPEEREQMGGEGTMGGMWMEPPSQWKLQPPKPSSRPHLGRELERRKLLFPPNRHPREIGHCLTLRKHRKGGREIPLMLYPHLLFRRHPPDHLDRSGSRIGLAKGRHQTFLVK